MDDDVRDTLTDINTSEKYGKFNVRRDGEGSWELPDHSSNIQLSADDEPSIWPRQYV